MKIVGYSTATGIEEMSPEIGVEREMYPLSPRELAVVIRLAEGSTNREIAQELKISVKTVDTHRGNALKKLRLRNNSDITRWAIRHRYVVP